MLRRPFLLFLLFLSLHITAQIDSSFIETSDLESVIEDYLQNEESESFDYNTLNSHLESLLKNPLNLNKVTEEDLKDFGILSDIQIFDFLNYRQNTGAFISIYELQSIPSFDNSTIRKILPFVGIKVQGVTIKEGLFQMIKEGENQLFLRWSRRLQKAKGYLSNVGESPNYLGDPNRFYLRFKHSYGTKLSYGITAEKDPGEEFFKGSNANGFDFYSAHFFVKDLSEKLRVVAIGDFKVNFGQGLIIRNGFSTGKSAFTMNIKRNNKPLERYSSVNEIDFMRGLGTTLKLTKNVELTTFISRRKIDGNQNIELVGELEEFSFSSLQSSGMHRTIGEIEDKNAIQNLTIGNQLKWKSDTWHISANALFNQFDQPLILTQRVDNQFNFSGIQLFNFSLDYSLLFRNLNFFGESAMSDNGAFATSNGLLAALDQKLSIAVLFRYFPKDFHHLNGQPFAEKRAGRNETGLYFGLEMRPFKNWKLNAYYDFWENPWLGFTNDAPAIGNEWLARLTYSKRRSMEFYVQIRNETKSNNLSENQTKLDLPVERQRFQTRVHFSYNLTQFITLKSRVDFGTFKEENIQIQKGISMYQDLIYRPKWIPFSFTTRFAIFDTDGYDVRYYHYENDLLYNFSIPSYYNEGTRFYLNVRYRGIRNLMLEARYAQTFWNNQSSFSSGNEEILGQLRSEIKFQLRYKF